MDLAAIDRALTDPGFFVNNDPHPLWQQLRRDVGFGIGELVAELKPHHQAQKLVLLSGVLLVRPDAGEVRGLEIESAFGIGESGR